MTVNFHYRGTLAGPGEVHFGTADLSGRASAAGERMQLAGEPRTLYHVTLEGLQAGTVYRFRCGRAGKLGPELRFRTPAEDRLRFVDGGDVYLSRTAHELFKLAGQQDPDFGIVGGDIAYEEGKLSLWTWWDEWLDMWSQNFRAPDGRLLPLVFAIGNHDVRGNWEAKSSDAPFFFHYLAQDPKSYFLRRFGLAALVCLDTGHIAPQDGEQARWLAQTLARCQEPFVFASYHVPLYPSLEPFALFWARQGRTHWVPSFDKHRLSAAFEHHEHTFKRTHRLKGNKVDKTGTVFFGDGAWGQAPRALPQELRWYEERHGSVNHFWRVDLTPQKATVTALGKNGKGLDRVELNSR